jgi:hypothetical protein
MKIAKDCHAGEVGVLIGNGPSLIDVPAEFFSKYVTIGCNSLYRRDDAVPDNYCLEGLSHLKRLAEREVRRPFIEKVALNGGAILVNRRAMQYFGDLPPGVLSHVIGVDHMDDEHNILRDWSDDPMKQYGTGHTVMFFMLQLAFWMGLDPVLMVGIDHKWGESGHWHFYDGVDDKPFGEIMTHKRFPRYVVKANESYELAASRFREADRRLLNLTPDTGTDAFEKDNLSNWL